MIKLTSLFLLIFYILGCKTGKIVTPRVNNLTKKINLNGYYYRELVSGINKGFTNMIFLYQNGILFDCLNVQKKDFLKMDKYILDNFLNPAYPNNIGISNWGVYIIKNNKIEFEKWYPFDFAASIPTYISKGEIINDSTFTVFEIARPNGKEKKKVNEVYYFRQFSPKPDSINNFIK